MKASRIVLVIVGLVLATALAMLLLRSEPPTAEPASLPKAIVSQPAPPKATPPTPPATSRIEPPSAPPATSLPTTAVATTSPTTSPEYAAWQEKIAQLEEMANNPTLSPEGQGVVRRRLEEMRANPPQ